jgi:hypothetical protein
MTSPITSNWGRALARVWLAAALSAALAACGGGGGNMLASGGIVGTGDAGVVAVGTISALGAGSVTVNGQAFSTTGAAITVNGQSAAETALKVGMVVTVQGLYLSSGGASAASITYRAEVQGVVSGVDTAGPAFTVLGQHVRTDALTVFDGGTFATLIDQYVEVSGFRSGPGELLATLVQIRPAVIAGAPLTVRGTVSAFDPMNRTFRVGSQFVDYSQVPTAFVPPSLANGTVVDVEGTMVTGGDGLLANTIAIVATTVPGSESSHVVLEGIITDFASLATFRVNGQAVNGSGATIKGLTDAVLGDGVKVEVEGRLSMGIVVATTIDVEEEATFTLDGSAEAVSVAALTVTIAGQTLEVTAATQFEDKSTAAARDFGLASIQVGDHLRAKAAHKASALVATRIERLNKGAPPSSDTTTKAEGVISEFVSVADFKVGGRKVNASSAKFENGKASDLANGRRVAAEGTLSGDVLMASKVEFKSDGASDLTIEGGVTDFVSVASFKVAGQPVDASGATFEGGSAGDLADGRQVGVTGTVNAAGILVARKVEIKASATPTLEIEGKVASFVSVASFNVAGQQVDASGATFKNGKASDLADGRDVTVRGPLVGGVLKATEVEFHDSGEDDGQEVEGRISAFVSPANFVVAGRTVDASAATFSHGTSADLANGKRVEIHGKVVGAVLKASTVAFDD